MPDYSGYGDGAFDWSKACGDIGQSTALQAVLNTRVVKSANLSDLADPAAARTHLGLGTTATMSGDGNASHYLNGQGAWTTPGGVVGGGQLPIGAIYLASVSTDPATSLGYGTWIAIGAGRVLIGLDALNPAFDTAGETGGALTVASVGVNSAPTFTGTPFTDIINHTHPVTDPGHSHTQASTTTATGGASNRLGTVDTSSTAVNTGTATTGVTTANPLGGVVSITPAGTVGAPTFTGTPTSVVQPYLVVYMFERTV